MAGSVGLDYGSDGAAASASRTIDAVTNFSMMGRYNGNAGTSAGTMTFGWTKAAATYNPFSGGTTQVIVGVARDAGNTFRLGGVNGSHGDMGAGSLFGNSVASLTNGNWYRLEGTILFDAGTNTFTFNNISLDDFGATGAAEVTADLLSGTGKVVIATGFGNIGRAVFATNRDRGFQITDNYSAVAVPEPTAIALFGAGAIAFAALRFRKREFTSGGE